MCLCLGTIEGWCDSTKTHGFSETLFIVVVPGWTVKDMLTVQLMLPLVKSSFYTTVRASLFRNKIFKVIHLHSNGCLKLFTKLRVYTSAGSASKLSQGQARLEYNKLAGFPMSVTRNLQRSIGVGGATPHRSVKLDKGIRSLIEVRCISIF